MADTDETEAEEDTDDSELGDDTEDGAGEEDEEDQVPDPVRDRKVKKLSQEAKRHRLAAKTAKAEAAELRLQNAFLLGAAGKVNDLTAAWKLLDTASLTVDDEGVVAGVGGAVAALVDRYPYLAPDEDTDDSDDGFFKVENEPKSSGREANGPKRSPVQADRKLLEKKFPALRNIRS